MSFILGLDVGTAAGAAATKRGGEVQPCQLGEQALTLPSVVVLHDDGSAVTGEEAERMAGLELVRVARDLRRDPMLQADPIVVGGQVSTPYTMLRALYAGMVERVCQLNAEVPSHVVVAHPALPEGLQCDMIELIADELFPGALLVPEPVAGAVKFACDCLLPAEGNIAVYDLGGGTLDLALVRRDGDQFSILGEPSGLSELGGIDIDDMVLGHVDASLDGAIARLDLSDPVSMATLSRLRAECRAAKQRLSYEDEVTVDASLPGNPALVTMRRHELEELLFPRLEASIDAMEQMIEQAGLGLADIDVVALVGGSSRIPLVAELMRARTELTVVVDDQPELTVALGAAQMMDEETSSASVFPVAGRSLPSLASGSAMGGAMGAAAAVGGHGGATPAVGGDGTGLDDAAAGEPSSGGAYHDGEYADGALQVRSAGPFDEASPSEPAGTVDARTEADYELDDGEYAAMWGRRRRSRLGAVLLGALLAAVLVAAGVFGLRATGERARAENRPLNPPEVGNAVFPTPSEAISREDEGDRETEDDADEKADDAPKPEAERDAADTTVSGSVSSTTDTSTEAPSATTSPHPSTTRPPTTTRPATTTTRPTTTTTTSTTSTTTTTSTTSTSTSTTLPD